jgi:hypothetical protein
MIRAASENRSQGPNAPPKRFTDACAFSERRLSRTPLSASSPQPVQLMRSAEPRLPRALARFQAPSLHRSTTC